MTCDVYVLSITCSKSVMNVKACWGTDKQLDPTLYAFLLDWWGLCQHHSPSTVPPAMKNKTWGDFETLVASILPRWVPPHTWTPPRTHRLLSHSIWSSTVDFYNVAMWHDRLYWACLIHRDVVLLPRLRHEIDDSNTNLLRGVSRAPRQAMKWRLFEYSENSDDESVVPANSSEEK